MSTRLGLYLALSRGERGESLRTVATRAGRSHVYLAEIEAGAKLASADAALAYADAAGASIDEALRLWKLDGVEAIDDVATDARSRYRSAIRAESHRAAKDR